VREEAQEAIEYNTEEKGEQKTVHKKTVCVWNNKEEKTIE